MLRKSHVPGWRISICPFLKVKVEQKLNDNFCKLWTRRRNTEFFSTTWPRKRSAIGADARKSLHGQINPHFTNTSYLLVIWHRLDDRKVNGNNDHTETVRKEGKRAENRSTRDALSKANFMRKSKQEDRPNRSDASHGTDILDDGVVFSSNPCESVATALC